MKKQDYIDKKNKPSIGAVAGPICPKCHRAMLHKQNITLSPEQEKRDMKRYGRSLCDDCKTNKNATAK